MLPAAAVAFIFDLEDEEEKERQLFRRHLFQQLRMGRQMLRDVSNPFTLDEEYFRKLYRFTPEVALQLLDMIGERLLPERNSGIPPHLQLLTVLRFLAEGGFQKGFAQDYLHPVSQTTASRCLSKVLHAIIPSTQQERVEIQNRFRCTIRVPGIIGLIDCFLVAFIKPSQNEEAFYNYKVGTAMNVQVISNSNFLIRNIRVCPGSNNDRYVWQFSDERDYFETLRENENIMREEGPYYILGDSGYTPSRILLTPVLNTPEGSPSGRYTHEHVSTRCQIEQLFGILSNVWLAIKRARKLYYSPEKVATIITVCAILHNFRRQHGLVLYYRADNKVLGKRSVE